MTPDDPRHGTSAGAVAHRKGGIPTGTTLREICQPCYQAEYRVGKIKQRRRDTGNYSRVKLGDEAWSKLRAIPRPILAEALGWRGSRISQLLTAGPDSTVLRRTRDAILRLDVTNAWTPIGLQRRMQALATLGWSARHIANHYGSEASSLNLIKSRPRMVCVRAESANAILAAWSELQMSVAPYGSGSVRTRNHATRNGWAGPLAWDNIDDPNERPQGLVNWRTTIDPNSVDENVVERILGGDWRLTCTRAEREAVCARFMGNGGSSKTLAECTGWKIDRYWRKDAA